MSSVAKPLLIYDATCQFCRRWIARWQARTGDRVAYLPLQQPGLLRRLGVPLSAALRAIQLVTPRGKRYQGAEAVFRALGEAPGLRLVTWFARMPPVRWAAEWVYRRIARHRGLAGRLDALLFGRPAVPADTRLVRALFMSALGGVYLVAFTSLRRQLRGLYGERGIQPIRTYLQAADAMLALRARDDERRGGRPTHRTLERARHVPSLFWLDASDRTLVRACIAGQACSVLLMLGVAPRLTATAAWGLYLSFVTPGREFLSFQWDALLLETGLAAIVVAPPLGRRRATESPPWSAVVLMRWLAFRLYFESGYAKIASGDPTWKDRTACCYHYATQPLPTRLGWQAHQLPRRFQRLSTSVVLGLELGAPVLAVAPRRLRHLAFATLTGLQTLIAATGNYGFFNLLTVVDSLWLLDDEPLARAGHLRMRPRQRAPWWRRFAVALAAAPLVALSAGELVTRVRPGTRIPEVLARGFEVCAPFRVVNPYGLFAVMTTTRPEIIIEGSNDGVEWREYRFRFKPDDLNKPPRLAAPHQPRLDWQMWFAALGPPPLWFANLLARLLEGSPEVIALLANDPFPEGPPRFVRALLYEYRMTDRATRRRTGAWWQRELRGLYMPPVGLAPPDSTHEAAPRSSTVRPDA